MTNKNNEKSNNAVNKKSNKAIGKRGRDESVRDTFAKPGAKELD